MIRLLTSLALAQILFVNMHGHSVNMTLKTVGNGPGYQDFVDVARWAKNNLPEDAFVVSVKPRLFYVLSGKRGIRLSTIQEEYSKEFEKEKLSLFKRLGITHVVLDGVSGATRENIFPVQLIKLFFKTSKYLKLGILPVARTNDCYLLYLPDSRSV